MENRKASVSEIRESVNPVFKTARSCVTVNALLGDEDAKKLMAPLGFDLPHLDPGAEEMTPEMREFAVQMANSGFGIMVETRFSAANKFILGSGAGCVVDLPCGYTPRGIKLADTEIRYFGLDIPAVADEIAPAVREIIGENEFIRYFAVDATNYDSLKNALAEARGELLITTEGLLMYLTQSELDEVFQNIRALLKNSGGKWITTDNEILAAHHRLLAVLGGEGPEKQGSGQLPPSSAPANDFMRASDALRYVGKMGFNVTKIPVFDYLPETLLSLKNLTEEKQNAVRNSFKEMFFWVMTAKEDLSEDTENEDIPFGVRADLTNGKLNLTISGRLDTITSPELLSVYHEQCGKGTGGSISIDMSRLTYTSSAGLRVLLIMRKALKDGEHIHLVNMREGVKEIMDTAGFSDLFSCGDN